MAHSAKFKPTPTTGNTHRMGEEEEKNHVTRLVIIVNLDQLMNEVESTTKGVFSCINNNQVLYQDQDHNAYLYLDPMTHSMLQVLYQDLQTKRRSMVAYGTAMSKEMSIRYNHILAEAAQALKNIQIYLQVAEMQVDHPQKWRCRRIHVHSSTPQNGGTN